MRAGHTEAAVDIARLAGLNPAGVICEIMNDDGTMARLPDLIAFAQRHGLKLGTIADLIAYRRRTERLVREVIADRITLPIGGEWQLRVYASAIDEAEHLALIKGDLVKGDFGGEGGEAPVLVRMHAVDLLEDLLGGSHQSSLSGAMRMIAEAGRGAVVLIRDHRPHALSERIRLRKAAERPQHELRNYGIGAQILLDLGIRRMILLTNTPRTVVGLEGYGIDILEQRPIGTGEGGAR